MVKVIIKRWCGGKNKEEMSVSKLFSDPLKRAEIMEMGKRYNEAKKNKVVVKSNKSTVIEEKEKVKEIPVIGQFLLTKLVEKNLNNLENKTQKVEIKKKVSEEQVGASKEYLLNTIMQVATLVYNIRGGGPLAIATSIYKLWASSSQIQKEISIKAGLGAVAFVLKKPWNWFCKIIGRNKWKIGSGSIGGELGLEVTKHLNDQGITLVSLDNGKNMLVNENVKQAIQVNIDRMVDNGVNVTTPMVETMLREGKAIDLTKSTLEPLIKGFSPEKKAEILDLNIFSNEIATKHLNLEQVPSILQKSVNGVENVTNFTNEIIGVEGGNFSWFNLLVGIVFIAGTIYAGNEVYKAVISKNSEGFIMETGKFVFSVKDKIVGLLFGLTGFGFVHQAQKELEKQQLSPEQIAKKNQLDEVSGDDDELV